MCNIRLQRDNHNKTTTLKQVRRRGELCNQRLLKRSGTLRLTNKSYCTILTMKLHCTYFSNNEMIVAIEESKKPVEEDDGTSTAKGNNELVESDSEPSCDNFDATEMKDAFQEALSDDEIKD